MPGIRFFVSWLAASLSMFGLSYAWHGIILNDFFKLNYPLNVFLAIAAVVYLLIGLCLAFFLSYSFHNMNLFRKGLLLGSLLGTAIYILVFTFGISFNSSPQLKYVIVDLCWQIVEQGAGGIVAAVAYILVSRYLHARIQ